MDKLECSICDNVFDSESHRPRNFPCGHGICTMCIEACISRGNQFCPICKTEHGANSASDLPVSFLLEELLHKASMSASQKHESETVHLENSVSMCPKHKGIPLYFHCKSHNIKVCHSCSVIDHPPASCNLISLDDEIKEKKPSQIANIQEQIQHLMHTEEDLNMLFLSNFHSILERKIDKQVLLTKIGLINQDILKKEKSQVQIKDTIQDCLKKQKSFQIMENRLIATTRYDDFTRQCEMATNEIKKTQKWEKTVKKELNMRKEAELSPTSHTTTVFMDLSACGHSLGRVIIRVFGHKPHGRQFIMLALGTNGAMLKGAKFKLKLSNRIALRDYVTECGSRSHEPLLTTLKKEHSETAKRGRLFPGGLHWGVNTASFMIMTNNWELKCHGYFGDIITGIEVIDRAASSRYNITDVTISDSGIVPEW